MRSAERVLRRSHAVAIGALAADTAALLLMFQWLAAALTAAATAVLWAQWAQRYWRPPGDR